MSVPNEIILYHYSFSPYARRIVWYLQLRGISYAECLQPFIMPRPDLSEILGIRYRRIPVAAIEGEVYCDTRLILRELEAREFAGARPALGAAEPELRAVERLLERFMVDGGVFARAAQAIPLEMPAMNDPAFQRDRTDFTGRAFSREAQARGRPEALVHLRDAFALMETTLLADGREWVLKTEKPSLADIEAVWPFHWLKSMPGAVPAEVASSKSFPKVFAWVERFQKAIDAAAKAMSKPLRIKGPEAAGHIYAAAKAKQKERKGVDQADPTGLKAGTTVQVWPVDSGFAHKDQGRLLTLQPDEIAIAVKGKESKEVVVHFPRWGFRVQHHTEKTKI